MRVFVVAESTPTPTFICLRETKEHGEPWELGIGGGYNSDGRTSPISAWSPAAHGNTYSSCHKKMVGVERGRRKVDREDFSDAIN